MDAPQTPLRKTLLNSVRQQEVCVSTPLKVPASPLLKNLGYGTGVNVYFLERSPRPTGQSRSPWAIKRVSQRILNTNQLNSKLFNERIVKEADILRQLNHPNIVGFRALTKGNEGSMDTLALECCTTSLGTILEQRLDNGEKELPAKHIKKSIYDVARALDYLHTEAMFLHGDLKSHNILVKGDFEICKLCDFGVSLPLNKEGKIDFVATPHLAYVGTNIWCAPEVIAEEDVIDTKADIFSFGLVIYETIALRPPFMLNISDDEEVECKENETLGSDSCSDLDSSIVNISDNIPCGTRPDLPQAFDLDSSIVNISDDIPCGTRPDLPQAFDLAGDYNIVMELFYLCTNQLPADRPSANIIWKSLEKEANTLPPN